jgi:ribosomal protein S18 acetylase RimI-like enzyme
VIRTALASDTSAIRALLKSVAGFWDDTWRADVVERALGSAESVALVHVSGEAIDGFLCAHDVAFRAYLSELVVSPLAQGAGIGGQLLTEAEHRLAERGCGILIADVWREAEGFYRAHGWTSPRVVLLRKRLNTNATQPSGIG